MYERGEIERLVRDRLRSLRRGMGWSLDDLAGRSGLSPSTISRLETGKRSISLDVLLPLAAALRVRLDALLDVHEDDDVVVRPVPTTRPGRTTWLLTRPGSSTTAMRVRMDADHEPPEPSVHPGKDWVYVLSGTVRLELGRRDVVVTEGEAAEFATMTPHRLTPLDGPAEVLVVVQEDGRGMRVAHDGG